jgi:hypothetical protein
MCRSIKKLRRPEQPATEAEIAAASLQFVRKVSGFNAPSRANQEAFERATREVTRATQALLDAIQQNSRPAQPQQDTERLAL